MRYKNFSIAAGFFTLTSVLYILIRRRLQEIALAPPEISVEPVQPPLPLYKDDLHITRDRQVWALSAILLFTGAIFVIYAGFLFSDALPGIPGSRPWNFFGMGALLWVIGVWVITRPRVSSKTEQGLLAFAVVMVVALALFVRLYNLREHPYGVWIDEADAGEHAMQILRDENYRPMFVSGIHMSGVQLFTFAAGQWLFGEYSALSLRLVNVLWGVAGVIAAYGVGKELRGAWFGVLMAFFMATMRWSINFSRIAMTGIENPFFVLLTLYFALRLVKYGTLRDALGIAVSVGLGLWVYVSFRVAVIPIFIFVLIRWPYWKSPAKTAFLFSVVGLTVLMLTLPYIVFAREDPTLFSLRSKQTLIIYEQNRGLNESMGDVLRFNIPRYLEMFHFAGDQFGRHNLPHAPMLDFISGILFLAGLWYAIKTDSWLFLLILAAALLTGMITVSSDAPQANRAGAAMVTVAFCCALALEIWGRKLLEWRVPRSAILSAGAAVLVLVAYLNFDTYHNDQRLDYSTWTSYSTSEKMFADYYEARKNVFMSVQPPFYMYSPVANFVSPDLRDAVEQNPFLSLTDLPLRTTGEISIFLSAEETGIFDYVRTLYPGALAQPIYYDSPELRDRPEEIPLLFYVIDIPAEEVARIQGLSPENDDYLYAPSYGTYRFQFAGQLMIDGKEIQPERPVVLYQGLHAIKTDDMNLSWKTPEFEAYAPVPQTVIFHNIGEPHGLLGHYYLNERWEGNPAFVRQDLTVNRYIHELPLPRPYSVEWTGKLLAPATGTYTFDLQQVGYTEVYLDNDLILRTDKPEKLTEIELVLEEGLHDLRIRFRDDTGSSQIYLHWIPPGGEREPLPTLNLFPE